jgi:hypothetical protein
VCGGAREAGRDPATGAIEDEERGEVDEGGGVCLVVFLLVGDLGSWSPPGLLYDHQPCPCRCNTLYGLVGSSTGGPRFFVPGPIQKMALFIAAPSRRSLTVHFDFPTL